MKQTSSYNQLNAALHNNSSKNAFMVGQAQTAVKMPVLTIVSKSIFPGKANDAQATSSDRVNVLTVMCNAKKEETIFKQPVTFVN